MLLKSIKQNTVVVKTCMDEIAEILNMKDDYNNNALMLACVQHSDYE